MLELLRSQKLFYRLYFGKTNYDDLVLAQNDFLRFVGAPNESLILIIIILYVQILSMDQNNFVRVASEPNNYFEGYISAKLVITT